MGSLGRRREEQNLKNAGMTTVGTSVLVEVWGGGDLSQFILLYKKSLVIPEIPNS